MHPATATLMQEVGSAFIEYRCRKTTIEQLRERCERLGVLHGGVTTMIIRPDRCKVSLMCSADGDEASDTRDFKADEGYERVWITQCTSGPEFRELQRVMESVAREQGIKNNNVNL